MDQDFYITLIQKELLQNITTEEALQLKNWRAADAQNESFYKEIVAVWNQADGYGEDIDVNLDLEFDAVQEKIRLNENVNSTINIDRKFNNEINENKNVELSDRSTTTGGKVKPMFPRWMFVAAAAALLAFAIYYIPFLSNEGNNTFAKNTKIELSDGSIIIAQKGSRLDYPDSFNGNVREISFKGNAYFSIADDPSKPFIINSPNLSTTVLGTTFFIDDVDESSEASVNLLEGELKVKSDIDQQILVSGESVSLTKKSSKLIKNKTIETTELKWLDQNLSFKDEPLEEIATVIGNLFDKNVKVEEHLVNCKFSGELPFKDIDYMLNLLATVYGSKVEKQNQTYLLKGGKCK